MSDQALEMQKMKLEYYLESYMQRIKNSLVYFVCNVKEKSLGVRGSDSSIYETEFLSDDELEQIIEMFYQNQIPYEIFQNEKKFMRYILDSKHTIENTIVYNSAQSGSGAGRKALVPSFCNLFNIKITGSNPYVVSLCRHKYHVNRLLYAHNFSVPKTWLFDQGWLNNEKPPFGKKLIIKPIYESASIGIESDSITCYDDVTDIFINKKQQEFSQPIIAQEFIAGYEAEVPIICTGKDYITLIPVGLSLSNDYFMGDEFLDYEKIYFDKYNFYDFSKMPIYRSKMMTDVQEAAHILGMNGLCRIDFRISPDGTYYITDVSTNPHFIRHSSVHYAFLNSFLSEADILKTVLCSALN